MSDIRVPLGETTIPVALPDCQVTVAEPPGGTAIDVETAARQAVNNPVGGTLTDHVAPTDQVAVVVTDITRSTPDVQLLEVLLDELASLGVAREQLTIVVGLGLHRPLTDAELIEMLGEYADLAINHDPTETVTMGEIAETPIQVHETVAEADSVLSTGMVEPHQYAGFSGGAKTVAIGAGGEPLIRYTHGPEMLANDGVRLGRITNNPFRETVDKAGDLCGHHLCLNVTPGPTGFLDIAFGTPRQVVETLADRALEALSVSVEDTYDAVIAGVGAPKDANLYQTTRAATYVVLGARNPLRDGGRVVIPAALPEGAGTGTGEKRFYQQLAAAENAESLYTALQSGYPPGAQRAFVVARTIRNHEVYITHSTAPRVVEDCLMTARDSIPAAIEPGSDVLVVPDALNTLLV